MIARCIEEDPARPGPAEARLRSSVVHVWALVGHLKGTDGDAESVAASYELPLDEVHAALAYYRLHQAVIDARLTANAV